MPYADGSANMAKTFRLNEETNRIEHMERNGSKIAVDITPRNLKNLNKRVNSDDFTGGAKLDKDIEEQRRLKKMMKNKKGKA